MATHIITAKRKWFVPRCESYAGYRISPYRLLAAYIRQVVTKEHLLCVLLTSFLQFVLTSEFANRFFFRDFSPDFLGLVAEKVVTSDAWIALGQSPSLCLKFSANENLTSLCRTNECLQAKSFGAQPQYSCGCNYPVYPERRIRRHRAPRSFR
jgi:hypothetical protein